MAQQLFTRHRITGLLGFEQHDEVIAPQQHAIDDAAAGVFDVTVVYERVAGQGARFPALNIDWLPSSSVSAGGAEDDTAVGDGKGRAATASAPDSNTARTTRIGSADAPRAARVSARA